MYIKGHHLVSTFKSLEITRREQVPYSGTAGRT
jgi:hypothetical protein